MCFLSSRSTWSSERGGGTTGRSSGARCDFCFLGSFGSRGARSRSLRRTPAACSAPSSVGYTLSSLHALRGDELRESSEVCSLLRSSRASRVLAGEAWKDRRGRSRSDGSRDRSRHWRSRCFQFAVKDLVVIAHLNHYLPVNSHVVIDCGLLTAVDLVVLALARCPGVSGCGILTAAGLAWTALGVTGCGFCLLSVSVRAFASICSSGSSP